MRVVVAVGNQRKAHHLTDETPALKLWRQASKQKQIQDGHRPCCKDNRIPTRRTSGRRSTARTITAKSSYRKYATAASQMSVVGWLPSYHFCNQSLAIRAIPGRRLTASSPRELPAPLRRTGSPRSSTQPRAAPSISGGRSRSCSAGTRRLRPPYTSCHPEECTQRSRPRIQERTPFFPLLPTPAACAPERRHRRTRTQRRPDVSFYDAARCVISASSSLF